MNPSPEFTPYVSASESPAEFTLKAAIFGIAFGILFGAANAYLGLRAGLTISTSIPVAVMTVAAFRVLTKAGIREHHPRGEHVADHRFGVQQSWPAA